MSIADNRPIPPMPTLPPLPLRRRDEPVARVGHAEAKAGKRRFRGFTAFLLVMLVVSLVFATSFRTVEVKGTSMLPTLQPGRRVLTSSAFWLVGGLKKGDIVVLKEKDGSGYFIKRIFGMPGDAIPWAYAPRNHPFSKGKFIVPPDSLYVIGDNLPASSDSRAFGPVPEDRLLGKVVVAR